MKNIIFELYNGNIRPCEGTYPKDSRYKQAAKNACDLENELLSKLNDEEKELYNQLSLANIARNSYEDLETFAYAFHLGARIIMSCLLEGKDD